MNRNIIPLLILIALISAFFRFTRNGGEISTSTRNRKAYSAEYKQLQVACWEKFQNMQFENATECFKGLLNKRYSHNAKFGYALSLGYSKQYPEAVSALEELKNEKDIDPEMMEDINRAYKMFLKHKNGAEVFERNDRGNYFGDLTTYAVWRKPKSIKVYIYNDYNKKDAIYKAFIVWYNLLSPTVGFVFVKDPLEADITARAVDIQTLEEGRVGVTNSIYGYYSNNKSKLYMHKSDVEVSYNNTSGTPWSDNEFQSITLHEIGHALGIFEHSRHRGDIMYYDTSTYRNGNVSNRDVNTVKILYGNFAG